MRLTIFVNRLLDYLLYNFIMADSWLAESLQDIDFVDTTANTSYLETSLIGSLEDDVDGLSIKSCEKKELKTSFESIPTSSTFHETTEKLKMMTEDPKNYYYKYIKPTLDPDCSVSDIFCEVYSWPERIEPDFIDKFVQKRVDKIIASASCSNILNAVEEKKDNLFQNNINTSKSNEMIYSNFTHLRGASSCSSMHATSFEINPVEDPVTNTFTNGFETTFTKHDNSMMKRSFSASCLPDGFNRNLGDDSLQQPIKYEKDEFGFPVVKFSAFNSPKKTNDADVTHVVNTYRKFRTSLCDLQIETDDDLHCNDETFSIPVTALKEPPLSTVNSDIHVKKNQPNVNKGPMRAVMPVQTMAKAGTIKLKSPVKLAKGDSFSKSVRKSLDDGSFHENLPIAASTPTGRSRRDSTATNSSIRSLSEGSGTPKRNSGANQSYTICKNAVLNTTITYTDRPKNTRQPLEIKPALKTFVGIKRPSSAPVKSTPPRNVLSTEFSGNEPSIINKKENTNLKSVKTSLTKRSSNIPFKPANNRLSTSKQNNNSKQRKTSSIFNKENKK